MPEVGEPAAAADELCPVPFYSLQKFLGRSGVAREWDAEAGRWVVRRGAEVRPGMTLRLMRQQGGYDDEIGWTGVPGDKPSVNTPTAAPAPDRLTADGASGSEAWDHLWWSLSDHTVDVVWEVGQLIQVFGLGGTPEGQSLTEAARWHDAGKASPRWNAAVELFLNRLREKVDECLRQEADPEVRRLLTEFAGQLQVPRQDVWAKFPDVKPLLRHQDMPADRRRDIRRQLFTPFQPGFRHEAASALVAWKAWQEGTGSALNGLAVYLVACHHGKVRTVLRSTRTADSVFGISDGEQLPPIAGLLNTDTLIPTEPRRFGSAGVWDDTGGTFTVASTSWVSLVTELVGGLPAGGSDEEETSSVGEPVLASPKPYGPFRLAFLEMLLRVADARASACPGRGTSQ